MPRLSNKYILQKIQPKREKIGKAVRNYQNACHDAVQEDSRDSEIDLERLSAIEDRETKSQFTLQALVGKTITEHREIPNHGKFRKYSDENLSALIFSDGSFLANEKWGDCECGHIDSYFYDGERVLYSGELFGVI